MFVLHGLMKVLINVQNGLMKDPMNALPGRKNIAIGIARGTVLQVGFARHITGYQNGFARLTIGYLSGCAKVLRG